jgi:ATP-dependent exoDNAse (exonuclease V) alpha subunit
MLRGFLSDTLIKDTTNESGEFILSRNTEIQKEKKSEGSAKFVNRISMKGKQLCFVAKSNVNNGIIDIFSGSGKTSYKTRLGKMEPGMHYEKLPDLAAGLYFMNIKIGRSFINRKFVSIGDAFFMSASLSENNDKSVTCQSIEMQISDTLLVLKEGYETVKKILHHITRQISKSLWNNL